jgi:phage baseplate assembly protein W
MATILADRHTRARNQELYTDFKTTFDVHPGSNDLIALRDEDAVKQSVINIIKTSRYERPFQPNFGCLITDLLFENQDFQTVRMARRVILDAIALYEPRAKVLSVVVSPTPDENGLEIAVVFSLINNQTPITLQLVLTKVR